MKSHLRALSFSFILFLSLNRNAEAVVAITNEGTSPIITDSSINALVGYSFITGSSPLSVFSLGVWDDGADGLDDAHHVILAGDFDSVSLEIPAGTTAVLEGNFRFMDLPSSFILAPSTAYTIWVEGYSGSTDAFHSSVGSGPTFSADIVSAFSFYQHDVGGFPLTLVGGAPHVGPTFQYSAVPEPSAILLLFIGIGFLASQRISSQQRKMPTMRSTEWLPASRLLLAPLRSTGRSRATGSHR